MRGFACIIGISVLACASVSAAEETAGGLSDIEGLRACLEANLPQQSLVQDIRLQSTDAGGDRTLTGRVFGMRLNEEVAVMIRVDGPRDMAGARYLVITGPDAEAMWVYLPSLDRVRRIAGSLAGQTLWGSDFSYDDVKLLRGLLMKGAVEMGAPATWSGRPAVSLVVKPEVDADQPDVLTPYTRVELLVDAKTCVIAQGTFFDLAGPVKELVVEEADLMQVGERWMARRMVLRNLREESMSELTLDKVSFDDTLRARLFDPRTFASAP